eukprot:1140740-Pelagomonas_calceolata.AAC.6
MQSLEYLLVHAQRHTPESMLALQVRGAPSCILRHDKGYCWCTHTNIHTRAHVHTHTFMHARAYAHTRAHTHIHTRRKPIARTSSGLATTERSSEAWQAPGRGSPERQSWVKCVFDYNVLVLALGVIGSGGAGLWLASCWASGLQPPSI